MKLTAGWQSTRNWVLGLEWISFGECTTWALYLDLGFFYVGVEHDPVD